MVEIFKTNVQEEKEANKVVRKLLEQFPNNKINFDLEDCDKILRIECHKIDLRIVENILTELNCKFELLK